MRAPFAWAAAIVLALAARPAHAIVDESGDDAFVRIIGSARTFTLFLAWPDEPVERDAEAVVVERLRLSVEGGAFDHFGWDVAWDVVPVLRSGAPTGLSAEGGLVLAPRSPLRIKDFDETLTTQSNFAVHHNLDRLSVALEWPEVSVRVGRQAIGHGTARLFNATDIFSPFSSVSLDTEYKRGVDAVRLTVPIGEWHETELYAIANEDAIEDGMLLARWRGTFSPVDVSVIAGVSYGEPTFGLDVSAQVGGAGLYGEALVRVPLNDRAPVQDTTRATIGVDWYWADAKLQITLEGHYNGPGVLDPADLLDAASSHEVRSGETTLLGAWYTGLLLSYELTPLLRPSLSWMANWGDLSSLLGPALAWDFGEETAVSLGALVGLGGLPRGVAVPGVGTIAVPRSELGSYPYTFYTEVRLYF
jgi:hypothetical protein